jgi:signal transduction histidine kinase
MRPSASPARLQAVASTGLRMQLVDIVNHELRTPLSALLGHAELLQDLDLPEHARSSVAAIVRAGERLMDLAAAVSELTELDAVTGRLERLPVDLVGLADEVAADFTRRAAQRDVAIRVLSSNAEVCALLDAEKLRSALVALVKNAVEHTSVGSLVDIEISTDTHVVWIDVKDQGPGIPGDRRADVLGPVERTYTEIPKRGLGLAIADDVARLHGGTLTLHDNEPGGLCARLELPLAQMLVAC